MEESRETTPRKVSKCISPLVSFKYCFVCQKEFSDFKTPEDNTINLWGKDGRKTAACENVETYLNVTLNDNDFKAMCKSCHRTIQSALKSRTQKETSFREGRRVVAQMHLRTTTKRGVPTDAVPSSEPKRIFVCEEAKGRRKLDLEEQHSPAFYPFSNEPDAYFRSQESKEQMIVTIKSKESLQTTSLVAQEFHAITRAICSRNYKAIASCAWKIAGLWQELDSVIGREVALESASVCSSKDSTFRLKNPEAVTEFSFEKQKAELERRAPLLWKIVTSASCNKRNLESNKKKTSQSLTPALVSAASVILRCRSRNIDMNASVNGILLRRGGVDKMTIRRFNHLAMSISYRVILTLQSSLGKNNCDLVRAWAGKHQSEERQSNTEAQELPLTDDLLNISFDMGCVNLDDDSSDVSPLPDVPTEVRTPATPATQNQKPFILAGDNVNITSKARYTSKKTGNMQRNLFNCIASKIRVPFENQEISGKVDRKVIPEDVPLTAFLPCDKDNAALRSDLRHHIAWILAKHVKELHWFQKYLPKYLRHESMKYTKLKSETVCLGVLEKDENVSADIIEIMQFLQKFVPESSNADKVLSFGDELTCEREHNAQEDQRDAPSPEKRLEGLVPCIGDFHSLGNFLSVIWSLLYDIQSSGDQGTLYAARNFLNARNVPVDPMSDVDACLEFLEEKYTASLVLVAFDAIKQREVLRLNVVAQEQEMVMNEILDAILDEFVMPSVSADWKSSEESLRCNICNKKYKRVATLRKHQKEKHGPGQNIVHGYKCRFCGKGYVRESSMTKHIEKHFNDLGGAFSPESLAKEVQDAAMLRERSEDVIANEGAENNENDSDYVYNYTRCSILLGLMACDFNDARKYGDGERIIRLYKYLFLIFKLEGRVKYAYYTFQLLCQVFYLLPDKLAFHLIHNRFANNKGFLDTNVEIDREVEHWNRIFKMDCKEFNGKVTTKSIERASCSYQAVDNLIQLFDSQADVHSQSGKHRKPDIHEDVERLAEQLKEQELFACKPGRQYNAFPAFPESLFSRLDIPLLKEWMTQKIKKFSSLNVYDYNQSR